MGKEIAKATLCELWFDSECLDRRLHSCHHLPVPWHPLPASPRADGMSILCSVLLCLHMWLHSLFVNILFFLSGFYFLYFLKCYLLKVRVQPAMILFS